MQRSKISNCCNYHPDHGHKLAEGTEKRTNKPVGTAFFH
nr:MAG TPA: hypothetical protein [Caudoviricetes sp.]